MGLFKNPTNNCSVFHFLLQKQDILTKYTLSNVRVLNIVFYTRIHPNKMNKLPPSFRLLSQLKRYQCEFKSSAQILAYPKDYFEY